MRVVLDAALFENVTNALALVGLFDLADRHRHRVVLEPEAQAVFESWLGSQSATIAEELELLLNVALDDEAREPAVREIRVTGGSSTWTRPVPVLSLDDAMKLLEQPFVLLLEGNAQDIDFLYRMMTDEERRYLRMLIQQQLVRRENGGGISGVLKHIEEQAENPLTRFGLFALFDSDALRPGEPSGDSEAARKACERLRVRHHQLSRRAIENYLPLRVLRRWAGEARRRPDRQTRLRQVAALESLGSARHHHPMKEGLKEGRFAAELYEALDPQDRRALEQGFGHDIAELFARDSPVLVSEAMLREDSGWTEMRPIVIGLIELLR